MYHVINRGNYRSWIYEDEGAKRSFEETVFEALGKHQGQAKLELKFADWKVAIAAFMKKHYIC